MACANPWNLELSNKALQRTFVGQNLYSRVLGSKSHHIPACPCMARYKANGRLQPR